MLGYRSSFTVDLDDRIGFDRHNAVDTLLGEGFRWMRRQKQVKGAEDLEPLVEQTFPGGDRAIYARGRTGAGDEYAKLVYFDAPRDEEQWVTSLLIGLGTDDRAKPAVAIEIDSPPDPNNEGQPHWTARPKLVQQILDAYSCAEHGLAMGATPTHLRGGEGVEALLAGLVDPRRRSLVIVCAEDGTVDSAHWQKIMTDLTEQTLGQASVYVLDAASTAKFNAAVSAGHRISPYALRTFRPPIDPEDPQDGLRHRVLSAQRLINSTAPYLRKMYGRICREHTNAQPIGKFLRRLDAVTARELDRATHPKINVVEVPEPVARAVTLTETAETELASQPGPVAQSVVGVAEGQPAPEAAEHEVPAPDDERLRALEDENAELRAAGVRLRDAEAALREALRQANASIQKLEQARDESDVSHSEEMQQTEAQYKEELENQQFEWLVKDEEARKYADRNRTLSYQLDEARRLLAENGLDASSSRNVPEQRYVQELGAWEEIQWYGEEKFPNLVFTCDWKKMMFIADRDESGAWLSQTWQSLAMLDDYCNFRKTERGRQFDGGLREYLRGGAPGGAWTIPADRYHANESDAVKGTRKYASERLFAVPEEVDPSGRATMLSHIVIQTKGTVSPRMYFLDCTQQIGKIVIGYIGRHPRNTKTN